MELITLKIVPDNILINTQFDAQEKFINFKHLPTSKQFNFLKMISILLLKEMISQSFLNWYKN